MLAMMASSIRDVSIVRSIATLSRGFSASVVADVDSRVAWDPSLRSGYSKALMPPRRRQEIAGCP
jgi:hypothetical protein